MLCHVRGQIQWKLKWFTIRLVHNLQACKAFQLNMPYSNVWWFLYKVAKMSHLKMGTFYHFDLCHNVRNSIRFKMNKLSFEKFFLSWNQKSAWFFTYQGHYLHISNTDWLASIWISKESKVMFTLQLWCKI